MPQVDVRSLDLLRWSPASYHCVTTVSSYSEWCGQHSSLYKVVGDMWPLSTNRQLSDQRVLGISLMWATDKGTRASYSSYADSIHVGATAQIYILQTALQVERVAELLWRWLRGLKVMGFKFNLGRPKGFESLSPFYGNIIVCYWIYVRPEMIVIRLHLCAMWKKCLYSVLQIVKWIVLIWVCVTQEYITNTITIIIITTNFIIVIVIIIIVIIVIITIIIIIIIIMNPTTTTIIIIIKWRNYSIMILWQPR